MCNIPSYVRSHDNASPPRQRAGKKPSSVAVRHGAREEVVITSIWLRRIGDKVQVLIEPANTPGKYLLAIEGSIDGNFSHCAHGNSFSTWKPDPIA